MFPVLIPHNYTAYRFFPWLMIFSIILICVLGRDFGWMLNAERASLPSPTKDSVNGDTSLGFSISSANDNEQESSMDISEKGASCCHRRRQKDNNAAITTELQQCNDGAQDEDSSENLFTGQCVCVHCIYTNMWKLRAMLGSV